MKLITKDVDYAIKTLKHMAREGEELFPVSVLSAELDIPLPYLRKILQKLNKKGIVHSYKGKRGGFKLALSAHEIVLHDLIETFQGSLDFCNCLAGEKHCLNITDCAIRRNIKDIEEYARRKFSTLTVENLVRDGNN